ncbi:unnamed protein product (macronuclear) [Paramecium tetraurelia]|uniref:Myosin motor domain-containing protein n=1 Tax=Paramecium tetraurelia TaxID=5888 RepID=A0C0Z7_PARTE|nr:uncharacterized protein GSPATT00033940001 [Paramecium tetraurelia]CAK64464.1 unnamed protein product [Paramecium tetraurelia]|eukprot:XP_001431862.1 hypothetical protein (macronuclear) [Paramecium tetraurelia strain d4-2]
MQSEDNEAQLISSSQYYTNNSNQQINNSNQLETPLVEENICQWNQNMPYNIADIPNPSLDNILKVLKYSYSKKWSYIGLGHNNIILLNLFQDISQTNNKNNHDFISTHQNIDNQNPLPHILKLAEKAIQACLSQNNIQKTSSIIIQGISGSGKTQACYNILKYITIKSNSELLKYNTPSIEKSILSTRVILDAFGNAKTINNPDSSRYGFNLQIHFDNQKKIRGAKVITILFQGSRVIQKRKMERNFHIFYQLYIAYKRIQDLKSFAQQNKDYFPDIVKIVEEIEKLQLNSDFAILESHRDSDSDQQIEKDFENFKKLLLAFRDLNFSLQHILDIIQCVAGLIHLYEYNFTQAQELLKIQVLETTINQKIQDSIQSKKLQLESIVSNIIVDFYFNLFQWIQNKINQNLSSGFDQNQQYTLNIFDSFGLDIVENELGMQENKLEQLMQNYVYEKLLNTFYNQIQYNAYNLFQSENLNQQHDTIKKNDEIISLFENVIFYCLRNFDRKQGKSIKDMIKEQAQNAGVENVFIAEPKMGENLTQSQWSCYQKQSVIGIKHTGNEIHYEIEAVIKNNQTESDIIQKINTFSQNSIIKSFILQPKDQKITDETQQAINRLIGLFGVQYTFFVKCFSTNYEQAISSDNNVINTELMQSGIEQSALLLCQSYFVSIPRQEFVARYVNIFQTIKTEEQLKYYIHYYNIDKELYYFGSNSVLIKEHLKNSLADKYNNDLMCLHNSQNYDYYVQKVKEINEDQNRKCLQIKSDMQKRDKEIDELKQREKNLEQSNIRLKAILQKNFQNNDRLMSDLKKLQAN